MPTTHIDTLLTTLQDCYSASEDGWLWVALSVTGRAGGVVSQIEGTIDDPVEAARGVAQMVDASGADSAYLALCRPHARVTSADRVMWAELCRRVQSAVMIDQVVFNDREAWSMRAEALVQGGGAVARRSPSRAGRRSIPVKRASRRID